MTFNYLAVLLVPRPGIEPGWIAPLVFETSASTDSAIWALMGAKLVIVGHLNKFFCGFMPFCDLGRFFRGGWEVIFVFILFLFIRTCKVLSVTLLLLQ